MSSARHVNVEIEKTAAIRVRKRIVRMVFEYESDDEVMRTSLFFYVPDENFLKAVIADG